MSEDRELLVTDDQIKHMVNRFLGWRLPDDFSPDDGISFKRTFNDHMDPPSKHEPIGTNLFDARQAEAMVRHMIEGLARPPAIGVEAVAYAATVGPDAANENNRRLFVDGHQWAKVYGWDTASVEARCEILSAALATLQSLTLALHIGGLDGLRSGAVKIGERQE